MISKIKDWYEKRQQHKNLLKGIFAVEACNPHNRQVILAGFTDQEILQRAYSDKFMELVRKKNKRLSNEFNMKIKQLDEELKKF